FFIFWIGGITKFRSHLQIETSLWLFNYNLIRNVSSRTYIRMGEEKCIALNKATKHFENFDCRNEFPFICRNFVAEKGGR
ncbi:hypothetical protein Avbf_05283, partial [Armadillidium vulgare]